MINQLRGDLRFGLRSIRNSPGFASVVMLTLALGIGLATAMFSVVNGLLLEPIPYPHADRLVTLWQGRTGMDVDEDWFSVAQFVDIKEGTTVFEDITIAVGFGATLTERGAPTEIGYVRTTSTFMDLIGATPAIGRLIDPGDDAGDAQPVALLSHALWQSAFGGDPDVVGQSVTLNGMATTIVGVLSRDVLLDNEVLPTLGAVDPLGVVLSLPLTPELLQQRGREDYNVMGRLKAGVSLAQVQAELDVVASRIQELHETDPGSGFFIRAVSLLDEVVGDVKQQLWLLLGSVAVLLLIACGNVANLLLSRANARQRELGIRSAVGASQPQLVRQMLTEGALVAGVGGLLGIALAFGVLALVRRIGAASLPRIHAVELDGRVLAFALVTTVVTCLLFALLPAIRAARVDLVHFMRLGARGDLGGTSLWSRFSLSNGLIVAEIGLSFVLLVGGGLLGRSMIAVRDIDPGFESDHRLSFRLQLAGPTYPAAARRSFMRDLTASLSQISGVRQVGGVTLIPFGGNLGWTPIRVPGYVPPAGTDGEFIASVRVATREYFETIGIPVRNGGTFEPSYEDDAPTAVIIDQQIADKYYAGRDPIGQLISFAGRDSARVVGVVGPIKHTGLDDMSRPTLYLSHNQFPTGNMALVLKTTGDPLSVMPAATKAVHALDPSVAIVDVATMDERIESSLAERRFVMLLLQTFSGAALALAAIGIFGLISYRVSRSTAELGVRMALGAQRSNVLRLVLRHGLALGVVGAAGGLVGALGVTRVMDSLLYGIQAFDPATYAAVLGGLLLVIAVACLVPAYQATLVDPLEALRSE